MGKRKHINSQEFVEEAIKNIRDDRAMASTLLIELMKILKLMKQNIRILDQLQPNI